MKEKAVLRFWEKKIFSIPSSCGESDDGIPSMFVYLGDVEVLLTK